jgi:hypothetical protein
MSFKLAASMASGAATVTLNCVRFWGFPSTRHCNNNKQQQQQQHLPLCLAVDLALGKHQSLHSMQCWGLSNQPHIAQ